MRKKVLNGKRVMALALALSLTIGEAGVAVAAPVDAEQTETVAVDVASEETAQQEADATVSANEGEVTDPETEQSEEAVEEEEDIDAEEKVDGSLSKVIGVEANGYSYNTITDRNGSPVLRYVQRNTSGTKFEVPGKVERQKEAPYLYSCNGKLYDSGNYDAAKNTTVFYTGYEMTAVAGQPENFKDPNTGLYVVNGAYYAYLTSDSSNVYVNVNSQVVPMPAMTVTSDYYVRSSYVEAAVNKA